MQLWGFIFCCCSRESLETSPSVSEHGALVISGTDRVNTRGPRDVLSEAQRAAETPALGVNGLRVPESLCGGACPCVRGSREGGERVSPHSRSVSWARGPAPRTAGPVLGGAGAPHKGLFPRWAAEFGDVRKGHPTDGRRPGTPSWMKCVPSARSRGWGPPGLSSSHLVPRDGARAQRIRALHLGSVR